MLSTTNTSSFGYWESPVFDLDGQTIQPGSIPLQGPTGPSSLYTASFLVHSQLPSSSQVPQMRLRTTAENLQQSTYLVIDSGNDGAIAPNAAGREYTLFFAPAQDATRFQLEFDMLNFNSNDAAYGDLQLDTVTVARRDIAFLEGLETVRTYTFDAGTEGWVSGASSQLTPPLFGTEPGALTIRGQAGSLPLYGYWGSPEDEIAIDSTKIYAVTFEVESDVPAANRDKVPQFRCRVNEGTFHQAMYLSVESRGTSDRSPVAGEPQEYTVYFQPPDVASGSGLISSFDLLHYDTTDKADAAFKVKTVTIQSVDDPLE